MNREFVSPFPSCWPGLQQTLNPKIRTLSSPSSTLLLQPNVKTKALHGLELCLLVVPRQLAISPLPIKSTTSDTNGSFEGNSWKGRQWESLDLFYITDVCHVLAVDSSQWKMRQITIWDSITKKVYPKPHLRWFHREPEVWLSHNLRFAVEVHPIFEPYWWVISYSADGKNCNHKQRRAVCVALVRCFPSSMLLNNRTKTLFEWTVYTCLQIVVLVRTEQWQWRHWKNLRLAAMFSYLDIGNGNILQHRKRTWAINIENKVNPSDDITIPFL